MPAIFLLGHYLPGIAGEKPDLNLFANLDFETESSENLGAESPDAVSILFAQASPELPDLGSSAATAAAPQYTQAQINEMINNPIGELWLLFTQNDTTVYYGIDIRCASIHHRLWLKPCDLRFRQKTYCRQKPVYRRTELKAGQCNQRSKVMGIMNKFAKASLADRWRGFNRVCRLASFSLAALSLAACTQVGPDFEKPDTPLLDAKQDDAQ